MPPKKEEKMPSLFVLDVPEFEPLVTAARRDGELEITGPKAGYFRIASKGQLRIRRAQTGLPEALWFGAFTAGYDGEELVIDSEQFWIGPRPKSADAAA
jgi:hypothetical protein